MRKALVLVLAVAGLAWAAGARPSAGRGRLSRTVDLLFGLLFAILAVAELSLLVTSWATLSIPLRALYAGAGLLFAGLAALHLGRRWGRSRGRREPR